MRAPCSSCGRTFRKRDGLTTRCTACKERAKVYGHQLHRRRNVKGYTNHRCHLCTKHRKHVRMLRDRWDERGIYVWMTCSKKGHRWFHMGGNPNVCPTCSYKAGMAYLRSLKQSGAIP